MLYRIMTELKLSGFYQGNRRRHIKTNSQGGDLCSSTTMFLFRTRENAQRKYVDLIKEAAARWPNWDPPRNIRVSSTAAIAINSRFVSAFLTPHQPNSQVTLAPSTNGRGSWRSKGISIPTLTPWESPAGLLLSWPPRWISSRSTRMKCGG